MKITASLKALLTLILSALVFNGSGPVVAQEDDLPDFIRFADIELAYPEGIWFNHVLDIPAEGIVLTTLTLEQIGWSGREITIDLEQEAEIVTPFTDIDFVWSFPIDDPPVMFNGINATWRFILTDGRVGEVSRTTFMSDPRTSWTVTQVDDLPFRLVLPTGVLQAELVTDSLAQIYELLRRNTGLSPTTGLALYEARLPFNPCEGEVVVVTSDGTQLPCSPMRSLQLYQASNITPKQVEVITVDSAQQAAAEALFDAFYGPLWEGQDVPLWLYEGLKQFYVPNAKQSLLETSRQAVRTGSILNDLDNPLTDDRRAIWEAQSYGIVLYIAEQIGVDGLFQLADAVSDGQTVEAAYEDLADDSFGALLPAWSNWIFSVQAETAYGYDPYLPTTPTPTATLSPTPFPPTLTFTPTFTPPPTITPTVTGFLSPTPRASRTFTPTFTPSFTPRPAQSFQITEPEAPAPPSPDDNTMLLILIAGGGVFAVLVLILVIVFVLRSNRNKPEVPDDAA